MEIKTKMRLSRIDKNCKNDVVYYIGHFLDKDDNKYSFFIDEKFYNELLQKKQYDFVDLTLLLYKKLVDNKTYYKLSIVL